MTRYCCPDCEDHIVLDDDLYCEFCKGGYIWLSEEHAKILKSMKKEIRAKMKEQKSK